MARFADIPLDQAHQAGDHLVAWTEVYPLFTTGKPGISASIAGRDPAGRVLIVAYVLLLDEPTNDLDAETLDLLEDLLVEYQGTLLLVSHDREFLDNVVTSTLVFEGDGRIEEYIGGYSDWLAQGGGGKPPAATVKVVAPPPPRPKPAAKPRKITQKELRELETLPKRIEELETEQVDLTTKLADPGFYAREPGSAAGVKARLEAIEQEITATFARWEELEAVRTASV